jgi:hypothetical protein
MHLKALGTTAALLILAAPLAAHDKAGKAATVAALPAPVRPAVATVDAFHSALHEGHEGVAAALLAEDALIFESGGAERSKAEYVAHHLPADVEFERSVSSSVARRTGRADGTSAWVASEGRTVGSYKGKTIDLLTTETMVLRRVGGAWKIVHIHWSSATKR